MIQRDSPDLNFFYVTGVPNPGKATITGASRTYKWDIQDGRGQIGASTVLTGTKVASFTVTIEMWTQEQLAQWDVWKKLLSPPLKPGAPGLGVKVSHPLLLDLGITDAALEEQSQVTKGANGIWHVSLKFIEYRKRQPMPPKKLRGSIPGVNTPPAPAQSAADAALVEARAKAEAMKAWANGTGPKPADEP